ncbi:IPTL-CTERM sorting domain-containing protein [Diaphorobacter ruginosibacter]|jgi:hypothetical protein|uniref:IPTL-CTERM sorting domain-containing protein n=1 Tax=Diaphorobacter ruginosibacter TaxID=1715720 RepID=UPI00333FEA96
MTKTIGIAALAISAIAFGSVAHATPIKWTLSNVIFGDSGTASGSFVYDADTNTFSMVSLSTTAGSSGTASTFSSVCSVSACPVPSSDQVVSAIDPASTTGDMTNIKVLYMAFATPLTNSGGTVVLTSGASGTCINSTCSIPPTDARNITGGQLNGVPYVAPTAATPVPALNQWGLVLLASLLGSLAFWRQRRKP